MILQTREIERPDEPAWEAYVSRHPQATLFHRLLWRDAVAWAFGHEPRYLAAWRDGRIVGVFPAMRVASKLAGSILVSVPYAVYGGAISDDAEAHESLLTHARHLADSLAVQWLDIRSVDAQWPDLPVVKRYVTFRKTLPGDPSRVLGDMPRKARAAARQARDRYHLEARFSDEDLDTVWSLYSQSMRRLCSLNYPLRFFRDLLERTVANIDESVMDPCERKPGHVVQLVLHRGKPIAGLVSFIHRDTLMPYFAGCDERFEKMHPNNFLYLAAMERGVELGCRDFDFGRSRVDNEGAYNFKRFQGFEPMPLNYQYYVPAGGREPDLHPGNTKLRLAQRVWPRLPLSLTRPLGAWLAKSIPG